MNKTKSAGSAKAEKAEVFVNVRLPIPPELDAKIRVNAKRLKKSFEETAIEMLYQAAADETKGSRKLKPAAKSF